MIKASAFILSAVLLATESATAQTAPATSTPARQAAIESDPELPAAIDKLAAQILAAVKGKRGAKIAVAPFINLGPTAHQKKLGEVTSELLVTRLTGKEGIQIIERAQLNQVLDELKLSMLGLTEGSNAEKVGKLLGAEAMIVGSVSEVGDQFAISARHVDVGTGQVAFAKEVRVPQAGTIALSSKYVVTKSRSDAFFRSLLLPGWGQQYNNQETKGWLFSGLTVGLGSVAVAQHVAYRNSWNKYMNATSPEQSNTYYDKASTAYANRNIALMIIGGVWAANAIDALINGTSAAEVKVSKAGSWQPTLAAWADGTRVAALDYPF